MDSPLSDEVLDSMITRAHPMDQWHLTQVLVENSPLNPGVYSMLKNSEVLGTFFMNTVLDAQQGQGTSSKQLLEQELLVRRDEQASTLAQLGWMWGTDTVSTTGPDSLRALFFQPGALDFTQARIELLSNEGDFAGAAAQMSGLRPNYCGYNELQALLAMGTAHGGQWNQLTATERDSLRVYAERKVQGAGMMAGVLIANGFSQPRIDPVFPRHARAMQQAEAALVPVYHSDAITAYPDPADDMARITFPAVWKGKRMELVDTQGRVASSILLAQAGLVELWTAELAAGVYQVRILGTNSTGRLIVKH